MLNVYNWSDYVDPAVLEEFTKETGIKVRYDTFDTNDMLEAKLLAGRSGYDVVAPTGYFLERQIKARIFQPLDKSKLPNLVHLWPEISQRLAKYDPGNVHAVNYMWGTTGIGYNVAKAREMLGARRRGSTAGTWCSSRRILGRFKDCGIHMLDSADDILPAALHYLGLDPNTTPGGRLAEGRRPRDQDPAAGAQVPRLRISQCARHRRNLLRGRILGRHQAGAEARGGGQERHRDRLCDPEGGRADLVRQSRDPARCQERRRGARVHQFPADARRSRRKNSNFISYANGNLASQKFIDKEMLEDRTIYPDAAMMSRLYTINAHDAATTRLLNRLWTRIKTGRSVSEAPHRQRRCSHSHCSGCSRTQPSITEVIACMVPCDVDLAVGVARRRRAAR